MLGNKDVNIASITAYVIETREWMGPGGLHGLQIRWQAAFAVCGGFDSLALPPTSSLKIGISSYGPPRPIPVQHALGGEIRRPKGTQVLARPQEILDYPCSRADNSTMAEKNPASKFSAAEGMPY